MHVQTLRPYERPVDLHLTLRPTNDNHPSRILWATRRFCREPDNPIRVTLVFPSGVFAGGFTWSVRDSLGTSPYPEAPPTEVELHLHWSRLVTADEALPDEFLTFVRDVLLQSGPQPAFQLRGMVLRFVTPPLVRLDQQATAADSIAAVHDRLREFLGCRGRFSHVQITVLVDDRGPFIPPDGRREYDPVGQAMWSLSQIDRAEPPIPRLLWRVHDDRRRKQADEFARRIHEADAERVRVMKPHETDYLTAGDEFLEPYVHQARSMLLLWQPYAAPHGATSKHARHASLTMSDCGSSTF